MVITLPYLSHSSVANNTENVKVDKSDITSPLSAIYNILYSKI